MLSLSAGGVSLNIYKAPKGFAYLRMYLLTMRRYHGLLICDNSDRETNPGLISCIVHLVVRCFCARKHLAAHACTCAGLDGCALRVYVGRLSLRGLSVGRTAVGATCFGPAHCLRLQSAHLTQSVCGWQALPQGPFRGAHRRGCHPRVCTGHPAVHPEPCPRGAQWRPRQQTNSRRCHAGARWGPGPRGGYWQRRTAQ